MSERIHIRLGGQSKKHRLRDLLKQAEGEPTTGHQPGETVAPTASGEGDDHSLVATPLPPIQPKPPGHAYRPPFDHEAAGVTAQQIELEGSIPPPRTIAAAPPATLGRRLAGVLKVYGLLVLMLIGVALASIFILQI
ncbi:hypothetical protein HY346_03355 [Candidatus Microgenomates bacterium]|nr:hypothetical protein [Candidatus Microgenomates bacterium]